MYVDLLPPCNAGCPAGENIQAWLAHVSGRARAGLARAGRRQSVRRRSTGGSATTRARPSATAPISTARCRSTRVERFLGDLALRARLAVRPAAGAQRQAGALVGAGPSGLSAAYHLARLGHEVEIRDAGAEAGRDDALRHPGLPAAARRAGRRVERIAALGVRDDLRAPGRGPRRRAAEGGFDAVFVAVGAHLAKRVDIPARDAGPIVDAVSFLRGVASGERPVIGRHVAVYGGGNTAMDAARVARRLGAEDTVIIYRRTRAQMPAHDEEAQDAEREGVRINWLRTITAFDRPEIQVEVMELDESGRPRPTGQFETLAADTVIMALGQDTESGFMRACPAWSSSATAPCGCRRRLMTGCPGRVRRRRHGARRADGDRRRRPRQEGRPPHRRLAARRRRRAAARSIRPRRSTRCTCGTSATPPAAQQPELAPDERVAGFEEVVGGLSAEEATLRGGPVPVVRQLLRVRRLPRRLPGGRGHQARRRARLPLRLRPLHRLRRVLRAVPRARDRDGPGAGR